MSIYTHDASSPSIIMEIPYYGLLMHLIPTQHSVTSIWKPESGHNTHIYTMEMGKCDKATFLRFSESRLLNISQHSSGSREPTQIPYSPVVTKNTRRYRIM